MDQQILPETPRTPYYPALDGLRTVAVALVFCVHYLPLVVPFGWFGVQVFFVLSGFLITGILFDTRHAPHRFRDFYIRRTLRIFPLYYGFLLVCLAVLLLTDARLPQLFSLWWIYAGNFFWLLYRGIPNDALFTGGGTPFTVIGHFWSLAVEEQFYLVWPVLVFAVKDRRRLMQLCLLLILGRVALAAWWQMHLSAAVLSGGLIYRMLPTQCDGFLIGGLLALWFRGDPSPRLRAHSGRLALAAILLYAALLTLLWRFPRLIGGGDALDYRSAFQAIAGLTLGNLVCGAVLLAGTRRGTWVYRLCDLSILRSLGRVSYGLYIFHLPILVLIRPSIVAYGYAHNPPLGDRTVEVLLGGSLTVGLAYASYYGYERPFLLLKNRFTTRRRDIPASATGLTL